ncbi:MAG: hypothetical protein HY290_03795 [Planctomycetia bacterium]|nr:hypothetical protein [Planctomycetia bacterium]
MAHSLLHDLRHNGMVGRGVYRHDGAVLATVAEGKERNVPEVHLWDTSSGLLRAPCIRLQPQFAWLDPSFSMDIQFSPRGDLLATGGSDKVLQFWETTSGCRTGPAIKHRSRIYCLAFHPLRDWILTACDNKQVYVWDIQTGEPVVDPLPHKSAVCALEFGPDRKTLAVQCKGMTVQLWNSIAWRRIGRPLRHRLRVNHVRFSPIGTTVLTTSEDRLIRFWNSRAGKLRRRKPLAIGGWIQAVNYSPDGTLLLTGNEHTPYKDLACEAQLWDAKTGAPIGNPIQHDMRVVRIAVFSPDGRLAATVSENKVVVTSVPDGAIIAKLKHKTAVDDAVFSPDSRHLMTCCTDNHARIWRIKAN